MHTHSCQPALADRARRLDARRSNPKDRFQVNAMHTIVLEDFKLKREFRTPSSQFEPWISLARVPCRLLCALP